MVLEQLSAVFRTPTLVSQTYFAAKGMEEAEGKRLLKHKERLEDDLLKVRSGHSRRYRLTVVGRALEWHWPSSIRRR